jgi:signal transduction histidine kinase
MPDRPDNLTSRRVIWVTLLLLACSVGHFLAPHEKTEWHEFLFKATYAPIILAALWFGVRGGLAASAATSLLYLLHVRYQLGGHLFTTNVGPTLDILLYNAIAFVTGLLSQRQLRARQRAERLADEQAGLRRDLEESYTALRHQTEELLRAEEQLRRTERLAALGELTAGIAHEIRNPLASITGAVQILTGDSLTPETRAEFTEILRKETARLDQAVRNILNFARTQRVERKPTSMQAVVERVLALADPEAQRHSVVLKHGIGEALTVETDPLLLEHILLNLVANAVQAMFKGGSVTVTAEPEGSDLVLLVKDTGPGIPPEMREQVFEPFVSTKPGGTGLGLSVARRIARGMGGDIVLHSTGSEGTIFATRIPLKAPSAALVGRETNDREAEDREEENPAR